MENFLITISYLLIGIFLRLTRQLPDDFSNHLNLYVIYVALPALILLKVPAMEFQPGLLFVAILPWIMVAVAGVTVLLLSRILSWPQKVTGCLLLMTALGNTSFLGIPMVRAFFGEGGISYAIIYDQLGSFLALATYGSIILAIYAGDRDKAPTLRQIAMKIATFPPFIALVAAIALRSLEIPDIATKILASLGSTLVPVVMVAVGYQLRLRLEPGALGPMITGLAIKLCAAPLVALALVKGLGLSGQPIQVAVFEAGMPPMVSAGALAIMANLAPRLTAALVGAGIFLSFITLPVLHKLISLFL